MVGYSTTTVVVETIPHLHFCQYYLASMIQFQRR